MISSLDNHRQCRQSVLQNGWQDTKNLEMKMIKKRKPKALHFKAIIRNGKFLKKNSVKM